MQNDVRISVVKLPILFGWPRYNVKPFNSPDLQSRSAPRIRPCWFLFPTLLAYASFDLMESKYKGDSRPEEVALTSEPNKAMFVSSISYFVGFDRYAISPNLMLNVWLE